jgi:hypothetical protein
MNLLTLVWNTLTAVVGLVVWPVARLKGRPGVGQVVRWLLHFLFLGVILGCLAFLNHVLELESVLRVPSHALRRLWLPLLFLLVYLLMWVGWWLWRLVQMPKETSAFPDIDEAWQEATAALERAGIDLASTPLFLLLGRPAGPESSLFNATGLPWTMPQTPKRPDAPLRVCANPEGIYITCAGASLLGLQASLLAEEAGCGNGEEPVRPPSVAAASRRRTTGETPVPLSSAPPPVSSAWNDAADSGIAEEQGDVLVAEEPQAGPQIEPAAIVAAQPAATHRRTLLKQAEEVQRCAARLKHVCQLIIHQRRPYCPLNGVLVLVPFAATDGDRDANQAALVLQRDLAVVQEAMQVRCPLVVLVCDAQQAEGCQELLDRFPPEQRKRRLGAPFPNLMDADADKLPAMIGEAVAWLCEGLIPPLVYRLMHIGKPSRDEADDQLAGNLRLYRFLHQIRERQQRLCRILLAGIVPEGRTPWHFGGCYLAATGPDVIRQQAFATGILPQLVESQNRLCWTPAALKEDAACRRWALAGYVGLGLFIATVLTIGWLV